MREKPKHNKINGKKRYNHHKNNSSTKKQNTIDTKVFALGGLNEIGKNMYCIEHDNEILTIDAGVKFAEEGVPGNDYVNPD